MSKLSLYDLVGDLVLYRNLDPVDARLPQFADAWAEIGLADATRPRKHEASYAQTTAWYLRRARGLNRRGDELAELVYLGDTAMADGNAFRSLRSVTGWPGWAFIGAEKDEELSVTEKEGVYVANRWSALAEFASLLLAQGAALDARTAVVVDIDKTALGARGRNDRSIDRARVAAIEATVAEAIGAAFDRDAFRAAYGTINVAKYHPFTADNQDYLAYICLMISAGFTTTEDLLSEVDAGRVASFRDFIEQVEAGRDRLPSDALEGAARRHLRSGGCRRSDPVQSVPAPRVSRDGEPYGVPARRRAARPAAGGRGVPDARGGGVRPLARWPRLPAAGRIRQARRGDHAHPGAGGGRFPPAAPHADPHRRPVDWRAVAGVNKA